MPTLKNPRWEIMATSLAKGYVTKKAYASAGFKPDDGHAARLAKEPKVVARVKELRSQMAAAVAQTEGYEAKTLFARIRRVADAALAAGNHKTALDGEMFIAECFGFKDSPTLTHEKINGEKLAAEHSPATETPGVLDEATVADNVMRFGPVLAELRKKREAR